MKSCENCRHAEWQKTKAGRLHPSGVGRCKYPYEIPQLPESMYWLGCVPKPYGGAISRKEELKEHCTYFNRE